MCKFRQGNEREVYKVKKDNSLNRWQVSNNWIKQKQRKLYVEELKNSVRILSHIQFGILFPPGYLKT